MPWDLFFKTGDVRRFLILLILIPTKWIPDSDSPWADGKAIKVYEKKPFLFNYFEHAF